MAEGGLAVDQPGSIPEVTAMGGTIARQRIRLLEQHECSHRRIGEGIHSGDGLE